MSNRWPRPNRTLPRSNPSCIVSAVHRETGALRVVTGQDFDHGGKIGGTYRYGTLDNALRDAVAKLEEVEGPWLVEAISTPATILRDLTNPRFVNDEARLLHRIRRDDLAPPLREKRRKARRR